VLEALVTEAANSKDGGARDRLEAIVAGFGPDALPFLTPLLDHADWRFCRTALAMLGRVGGAEAVAALQARATAVSSRGAREAIAALVRMEDPAADASLGSLLRDGSIAVRRLMVEALVASRRRGGGALLTGALATSDLLGRDHRIALAMLTALRQLGDESSMAAVEGALRAWSWAHPLRSRRIRRLAAQVIAAIGERRSDAVA
jgi:HEAT repeat protein